MNKRIIAVLLSLIMMFSLAACTNGGSEPAAETQPDVAEPTGEPQYKEEIVIGLASEFDTIDPQGSNADRNFLVQDAVFDLLTDTDLDELVNKGELCETVTMLEPDLWEFKLYPNVNFHDGTILDTDDVLFTFDRAKESQFCTSYVSQIEEVIKIDDLTFQMKLVKPNLDFNYVLANNQLAILSKEAFESMPEEQAATIGTGPWKYESYVPGEYVSLVRNEDSTFYETPNTKRLVFKMIPEASSRLIALQTGEIDICLDPSATDFGTIADDKDLNLLQIQGRGLRYIAFNLSKESPFSNELVRQAVACAINRDDIITVATGGYASRANNVLSKGCWGYTDIEGIPEDLEKAKVLMAEAGYPDGFSTALYYQNDTERSDIATVVQAQLAEIGITAELKGLEAAAFSEAVVQNGEHEICIGRWTPGLNPDGMFRNSLYSAGGTNYAKCKDAKLDELLDAAMSEVDVSKRLALYAEIQTYLTEELIPWVPIYLTVNTVAARADVEGLKLHPAALHNFKYVEVLLD